MAGRPAPFIELGVGFNPELSARENVVINGVMMGLSQREARGKLDAVLEFAELEDFADLKLKNYSSGMLVRLAFSLMIQSNAEILLIDEVLAVGDAAFQQKCHEVFREISDRNRTVVLVTHDMSSVQAHCHRAMLLEDGKVQFIGEPEEAARQYLVANFEGSRLTSKQAKLFAALAPGGSIDAGEVDLVPDLLIRVREAWLEGLWGRSDVDARARRADPHKGDRGGPPGAREPPVPHPRHPGGWPSPVRGAGLSRARRRTRSCRPVAPSS